MTPDFPMGTSASFVKDLPCIVEYHRFERDDLLNDRLAYPEPLRRLPVDVKMAGET